MTTLTTLAAVRGLTEQGRTFAAATLAALGLTCTGPHGITGCGALVWQCTCPASLRLPMLKRNGWEHDDLLAPGVDRMADDGAPAFGVTPAGRLPARPTPPRDGDAAAHLRQLVHDLERMERVQVDEHVAIGLHAALVVARLHAARAGVA